MQLPPHEHEVEDRVGGWVGDFDVVCTAYVTRLEEGLWVAPFADTALRGGGRFGRGQRTVIEGMVDGRGCGSWERGCMSLRPHLSQVGWQRLCREW
jgi:hypothetical protein